MRSHSAFLAALPLVCLLASFLPTSAVAQRSCASDSVHAQMMGLAGYPELFQSKVNLVNQAAETGAMDCASPLIIPVAVHFQNTGIPEACAIDMALDQIEILNQDFAAINPDISDWYAQQPTIWPNINNAESCIQFCLATLDHPAGYGLVDGDYAVTINQTTGDFNSAWSGYLNFWVRNIGPLGYSPLGGNGNGDGVTCHPQAFGSLSCGGNSLYGAYNLGRTITHEVGHYLLLNHPWGNGGCSSTDNVADTPVTDEPIFGCPSGQSIVNCTEPVLWPSYMDYCNDACLFMFSAGQVTRMENYVNSSLQILLNNATTVCGDPCADGCGCTDSTACNYDPNVATDDGSCEYGCAGCTDAAACNYDPNAASDDGSCFYPDPNFPCECSLDVTFALANPASGTGQTYTVPATANSSVTTFDIAVEFSNIVGGTWARNLLVGICDPGGSCIEIGGYNLTFGFEYANAGDWPSTWYTGAPGTYTATVDLTSFGLTGIGDWTFEFVNGWSNPSSSAAWAGTVTLDGVCPGVAGQDVEGCTDSTACNFNDAATVDDGSCLFAAAGFDCDGNATGGCPEDINGNGTVEVSDVLLLLSDFGCTADCTAADVDGDGAVSVTDILLLLAAFGEDC